MKPCLAVRVPRRADHEICRTQFLLGNPPNGLWLRYGVRRVARAGAGGPDLANDIPARPGPACCTAFPTAMRRASSFISTLARNASLGHWRRRRYSTGYLVGAP